MVLYKRRLNIASGSFKKSRESKKSWILFYSSEGHHIPKCFNTKWYIWTCWCYSQCSLFDYIIEFIANETIERLKALCFARWTSSFLIEKNTNGAVFLSIKGCMTTSYANSSHSRPEIILLNGCAFHFYITWWTLSPSWSDFVLSCGGGGGATQYMWYSLHALKRRRYKVTPSLTGRVQT